MKRTKSSRPAPPAPASSKVITLDDKIREQAYYHWIDNGCPNGDALGHWFAAEQQVLTTLAEDHVASP